MTIKTGTTDITITAAPDNPRARARAVLDAFVAMPAGEDFTFHVGPTEDGTPAVVVGMVGKYYGLMADEARKLASIMEDAIRAHPNEPGAESVPDFIMALRHSANVAAPVEPTVEYGPEVQAQMEADPKLAEAVRGFAATARQAMADVAAGKYASFDEAMFAITGNKPEPVGVSEVPGYKTSRRRKRCNDRLPAASPARAGNQSATRSPPRCRKDD